MKPNKGLNAGETQITRTLILDGATLDVTLHKLKPSRTKDWSTLEEVTKPYWTFSASAYTKDAGGQILEELYQVLATKKKMTEEFLKVFNWWKEYHLNDLKAGTERQTVILEMKEKERDGADWYNWARIVLLESDMVIDRGYDFGHAWLLKKIPDSVVEEMKKFVEWED